MNNEEWCKSNCPYYPECYGEGVCNYVLSLLKKEEPVPAVEDTEDLLLAYCGNCGHTVGFQKIYKFCPYCGREIKWNA